MKKIFNRLLIFCLLAGWLITANNSHAVEVIDVPEDGYFEVHLTKPPPEIYQNNISVVYRSHLNKLIKTIGRIPPYNVRITDHKPNPANAGQNDYFSFTVEFAKLDGLLGFAMDDQPPERDYYSIVIKDAGSAFGSRVDKYDAENHDLDKYFYGFDPDDSLKFYLVTSKYPDGLELTLGENKQYKISSGIMMVYVIYTGKDNIIVTNDDDTRDTTGDPTESGSTR